MTGRVQSMGTHMCESTLSQTASPVRFGALAAGELSLLLVFGVVFPSRLAFGELAFVSVLGMLLSLSEVACLLALWVFLLHPCPSAKSRSS